MKMHLLISLAVILLTIAVASAESGSDKSYVEKPDGVIVTTSDGVLRLSPYGPNAVRVTFAPGREIPEINSLAVIASPDKSGCKVTEANGKICLTMAGLTVYVEKATGVVSFYKGDQLLAKESANGRTLQPAVINGQNVLSVQQKFTVSDDEAFYGLGQDQSGVLNRAGKLIALKQGNTDKTVPVLLSSNGYGIFWDNPSYGKVDLTKIKSGVASDDTIIPSSAFITADGKRGGLTGEYFSDTEFKKLAFTRKDAEVNFDWSQTPPPSLPHDKYSVRWTGKIKADETGKYQIVTSADDGVKLWLDGKLIIDDWNAAAVRRNTATVKLEARKTYNIKLEFFQDQFDSAVQLRWAKPVKKTTEVAKSKNAVDISLYAEVANAIDYYFIAGPKSDDIIAGYRRLTGDAPMYGKWVYGYWQCKERYKSADELLEVAEGFRSRNIPIDNIIQDWMYWHDPWGCHEFDKTRYPDPAGLIKTLHEKYNLHVMISVWPKFMKGGLNYDEMDKAGYLFPEHVWFGGRMQQYYDPFSSSARELFWKQVNKNLFSLGIDAWWLDGDEPEITLSVPQVNGTDYGHPSVFHGFKTAMGPGSNVLNAYPLMHTGTFHDGQRKATDQKRVFLLSRCSYAGMQRNAATCWSGDIPKDWESLRKQIPGGLNFVMSGLPYWNTDIGGFWGGVDGGNPESPAYQELFYRWIQYGAFSPMMRVHGEHPNKEPWRFGSTGEKIITKYINLRYRLMPYIYSTAWMITNSQYSMMRPLVMDFDGDSNVRNISDQFMFGSAMMINPVTAKGATSREVYLPKGTKWVDFWTGNSVEGGQSVDAKAPVETVPIFVRTGSIVPMGPFVQYAGEKPADPIEIRIYPGADGKFVLYEDEGDTYNYEKGKFSTITLTWNDRSGTLTIGARKGYFTGMLNNRTFKIVVVAPDHGVGVEDTPEPTTVVNYDGHILKLMLTPK